MQTNVAAAHDIFRIDRRGFEFPNPPTSQGLHPPPRHQRRHTQLRQRDQNKNGNAKCLHAAARFLNMRILATRKPAPTTMNPSPRVTKLSSLSKKRLMASAAIRSK